MKSEDITGDLDLLGDWLDAKGYTEEAGLCTRAMDEINRLREALKPFSDEAKTLTSAAMDDTFYYGCLTCGDLRAARAAMGDTE